MKSPRRLLRRRRLAAIAAGLVTVTPLALFLYARLAPFEPPEHRLHSAGTVVLDASGVVLQRDSSEGFRIPVALDGVAPIAIDATIAAEDQRYRDHPGVDPLAVARAAVHLGSERSGASTITQQLARRLYLGGGGGPLPVRKVRESLIAFQLEAHRSKDEILALYLNDIYYGRGAYGIEAAARIYFGVSAANLDLARAAFLAGLPQLPSAYDPAGDAAAAAARQRYVLGRLRDDGRISAAQAEAAAAEPLALLPAIAPPIAPEFVRYALDELARVRPDLAGRRGLVIETTLDAGLHLEADRLIRVHLAGLSAKHVTTGAVVALDPAGRILAMVGGVEGSGDGAGFNMALELRQPGSALKPFLYTAAFEHGYTPASPLLDVPSTFLTPGGPYTPLNFDRTFHGVVSLRIALASSLNVPAVRMLDAVGIDPFLETAHRFGLNTFTEPERHGLALTLGGAEVRLVDLTAAYAAFSAGGAYRQPYAIARVRDAAGTVLYERAASAPVQAAQPGHAYLVADILADHDARVLGFGESTPFDLPFTAAVKTGTTTGFRDNWTLGFTASFTVGVWVGNTDGSPMQQVSGVDGAGPIWRDVMLAAAMERPPAWLERPAGIVEATVCEPTGMLPGAACPFPVRELFVAGTVPTGHESYYVRAADGSVAIDPPAEARGWARDAGLALAAEPRPGAGPVTIVAPAPGAVAFLASELPSQEMLLRATAPPGTREMTFRVDGEVAGAAASGDATVRWPLRPGLHEMEVTAVLADGATVTATRTFEVRRQ